MKVTAVVLNWRRPEETIACVRSVQETAPNVGVIVVDNASRDGSMETMRAALRDVDFVENDENRGYAGGMNVGVTRAIEGDCHAILILNNDVIVRPGCVARLMAVMEERETPIVAPVSLRRDDPAVCDFWTATVDIANMAVIAHGRDEPWWPPPPEPEESHYATGSAMLVAGHVTARVRPFDERFFLVWEDVDYCLRVEAEYGRSAVLAVPDAEVLHGGSVSFGGAGSALYRYFYTRNAFLMVRKHGSLLRKRRTRAMLERRFVDGMDRETDPVVQAALERGLIDGIEGRFGPPPADLLG